MKLLYMARHLREVFVDASTVKERPPLTNKRERGREEERGREGEGIEGIAVSVLY